LVEGRYAWVAFTSANAVDALLARLHDARDFGATRIAAIGPGTAAALAARSLVADLIPGRSVAEDLLAAWPPAPPGGAAVLLPRAAVARDVLPAGLAAAGWAVEVAEAYRTEPELLSDEALDGVRGADAICFTSASTVHNFLAATRAGSGAGPEAASEGATGAAPDDATGAGAWSLAGAVPPLVACIGPVTAAAAREAGLAVAVVADPHTIDGLVEALVSTLAFGVGGEGGAGREGGVGVAGAGPAEG
jgi:uroporphyrinogen-III synthase